MSLGTWKEEHYDEDALQCVQRVKETINCNLESPEAQVALLEHSLKKWSGCSQEEFEKHGVSAIDGVELIDDHDGLDQLHLDSSSCALCVAYLEPEDSGGCPVCPLYKERGKGCDHGSLSPYDAAMFENYKPMQFWLKSALNTVKSKL